MSFKDILVGFSRLDSKRNLGSIRDSGSELIVPQGILPLLFDWAR